MFVAFHHRFYLRLHFTDVESNHRELLVFDAAALVLLVGHIYIYTFQMYAQKKNNAIPVLTLLLVYKQWSVEDVEVMKRFFFFRSGHLIFGHMLLGRSVHRVQSKSSRKIANILDSVQLSLLP